MLQNKFRFAMTGMFMAVMLLGSAALAFAGGGFFDTEYYSKYTDENGYTCGMAKFQIFDRCGWGKYRGLEVSCQDGTSRHLFDAHSCMTTDMAETIAAMICVDRCNIPDEEIEEEPVDVVEEELPVEEVDEERDPAVLLFWNNYTERFLALVNEYRQEQGVDPFEWSDELAEIAGTHSSYMHNQGELSHDNFEERFNASRRGSCTENVAAGYDTAEALFDAFVEAPGYRANMLREFVRAEMGLAQTVGSEFITVFMCDGSEEDVVYDAEVSDAYAAEMLGLINEYRAENNLNGLRIAEHLNTLARGHNEYMQGQGELSHNNFEDRFNQAGHRLCVENVGWNFPDAASQLEAWQLSPGHNVNILNDSIRFAGIERLGGYVTFFACE